MVIVNKNPIDSHLPLMERLLHSPFLSTLRTKQKELCYAALACLFLFGGSFFWLQKSKASQIENYQLASLYADELMKSSKLFDTQKGKDEKLTSKTDDELFASLQALAKSNPLIKERYNGLIAEWLILKGEKKELPAYANKAIATLLSSNMPLFASFSKISSLTAENRFKEAFEEANTLQKNIEAQNGTETNGLLYAFTLLQEAAILRALGFHERAQKTVEKLKSSTQYPELVSHLQDKETSLLDFLGKAEKKVNN